MLAGFLIYLLIAAQGKLQGSGSRTANLTECLTLISLHYELTSVLHRPHPQGEVDRAAI